MEETRTWCVSEVRHDESFKRHAPFVIRNAVRAPAWPLSLRDRTAKNADKLSKLLDGHHEASAERPMFLLSGEADGWVCLQARGSDPLGSVREWGDNVLALCSFFPQGAETFVTAVDVKLLPSIGLCQPQPK